MEPDLWSLSVIRDIANNQDSDIQLTVDVPSLNPNGRLPVLDLQLSIVENKKVEFIFYKMPKSNPRVLSYSSAIVTRVKRDTILMEGYRRIRNCSIGVSDDTKTLFFHLI